MRSSLAHHPETTSTVERPARPEVAAACRLVVKLGTRVLVEDDGALAEQRLRRLIRQLAAWQAAGGQVILVSSGAVGVGRAVLGCQADKHSANSRHAYAAVGQGHLMSFYERAFADHGLLCAQLLVTEGVFDHRQRYLSLRGTLDQLLRRGVIPILNENDAVTQETLEHATAARPVFPDNDRLAALVAAKMGADLLVLLTDVEGVYDRPPEAPGARLFERLDDPSPVLEALAPAAGSDLGKGGMRSKVEAAEVATHGGCQVVIAAGRRSRVLAGILAGEALGTWFPLRRTMPAKRRWIAFAAAVRGTLHLDAGAVWALRETGASLLSVGVLRVDGRFVAGDVVELRGPGGELVGRGLMFHSAEAVSRWCGRPASGQPPGCLLRRSFVVLEEHNLHGANPEQEQE